MTKYSAQYRSYFEQDNSLNLQNTFSSILIVDDDLLICRELQRLGKKMNFNSCHMAANGREAIEKAITLKPDVILMDIEMPEMDGLTTSKYIQEQFPVPIVILTSYTSEELLQRASQVGIGAYLLKPPKLEELDRAITIACARHHDLMEQKRLVHELKQAHNEIQTLKGLLPVCPECKMIQSQSGNWQSMEHYVQSKTEAKFTHSLCPKCHKVAKEQF